jgi:hypothetical protein
MQVTHPTNITGEIIFYQSDDGTIRLETRLDERPAQPLTRL